MNRSIYRHTVDARRGEHCIACIVLFAPISRSEPQRIPEAQATESRDLFAARKCEPKIMWTFNFSFTSSQNILSMGRRDFFISALFLLNLPYSQHKDKCTYTHRNKSKTRNRAKARNDTCKFGPGFNGWIGGCALSVDFPLRGLGPRSNIRVAKPETKKIE